MYNILIAEDDTDISGLLVKILKEAGYETMQAFSGTEALLLLDRDMPDLLLLDLMLPGMSGEALLHELREKRGSHIPVLVISAKSELHDKVTLLHMGADDYITKPFEPEEIAARVHASFRRMGKISKPGEVYTSGNLKLYPESRKAVLGGKELVLTVHEFDILSLLMQNPDKVYSRERLYELVWSGGYYGENNTVNVHVSNLRKKLKEAEPDEEYIQTVYGIGFKLK